MKEAFYSAQFIILRNILHEKSGFKIVNSRIIRKCYPHELFKVDHSHFYANVHASVTLLSMKFSPKCRTKNLRMIYSIFGSFCSFFNWIGANFQPQIKSRKIPA